MVSVLFPDVVDTTKLAEIPGVAFIPKVGAVPNNLNAPEPSNVSTLPPPPVFPGEAMQYLAAAP
jgi:hypothetical protein